MTARQPVGLAAALAQLAAVGERTRAHLETWLAEQAQVSADHLHTALLRVSAEAAALLTLPERKH